MEQSCVWDDCASRSVTEEHGIAPAAFSLASELSASVEQPDGTWSGQVQQSEVKIVIRAKARGELPPAIANAGQRSRHPGISRTRVVQVQPDLVRAVPHAGRVLRQRIIRTPLNSRTLVGSWFAPNVSRREVSASCISARCSMYGALCDRVRHPAVRCSESRRSPTGNCLEIVEGSAQSAEPVAGY